VETPAGEVTTLLRAWSAGDRAVESNLFGLVLPELRQLAQRFVRREPQGNSLQATALINEAYVRLVGARDREWTDRGHFFAIAARIMRRTLIDYARRRHHNLPIDGLEEMLRGRDAHLEQAIAIDSLLDELEKINPDFCTVIELRFFVGLAEQETADALGITLRTAQRRYSDARRWLFEKLESRPSEARNDERVMLPE